MLFPFAVLFLGGAVIADLFEDKDREGYGYGEGSLSRLPDRLWDRGCWGLRGVPQNWRSPHYRGLGEFGVLTGAGGIRGVATFKNYTPEEQVALRRGQAEEGFRVRSVGPPG